MSAWLSRSCRMVAVVGILAAATAQGAIFEHVVATAAPDTFDGPCPTEIKLNGAITLGLHPGQRMKYVYRWENDEGVLTNDVVVQSSGALHDHVETELPVMQPVGVTLTRIMKLHVFLGSRYGKTVDDVYSLPLKITVTCR